MLPEVVIAMVDIVSPTLLKMIDELGVIDVVGATLLRMLNELGVIDVVVVDVVVIALTKDDEAGVIVAAPTITVHCMGSSWNRHNRLRIV